MVSVVPYLFHLHSLSFFIGPSTIKPTLLSQTNFLLTQM